MNSFHFQEAQKNLGNFSTILRNMKRTKEIVFLTICNCLISNPKESLWALENSKWIVYSSHSLKIIRFGRYKKILLGVGALYVRRRPRVRLEALQSGGGQERGLRSGTVPTPLSVGLGAACELAQKEMSVTKLHLFRPNLSFRFD